MRILYHWKGTTYRVQYSRERFCASAISSWLIRLASLDLFSFAIALPCAAAMLVQAYASDQIVGDCAAVGVHDPEIELRAGVALLGGEAVPSNRLGVVLGDALPFR